MSNQGEAQVSESQTRTPVYKILLAIAVMVTAAIAVMYYGNVRKENNPSPTVFAGKSAASMFIKPPYISPKILRAMLPSLSGEESGITTMNLTEALVSDEYQCDIELRTEEGANPLVIWSEDPYWFAYRCVGVADNGLIPVHVIDHAGGSGYFESVLILSLDINNGDRAHMVLTRIDKIPLGDRWEGMLRTEGDELVIETDLENALVRYGPVDGDGRGRIKLDY